MRMPGCVDLTYMCCRKQWSNEGTLMQYLGQPLLPYDSQAITQGLILPGRFQRAIQLLGLLSCLRVKMHFACKQQHAGVTQPNGRHAP